MKTNTEQPTLQERVEIANTMHTLIERGFTTKDAAACIPQWSYVTCVKWLRRIHGDNAGRRTPRGRRCSRCGGPPTERDAEEGLTRIRDRSTGQFVFLCSDCLLPDEEADSEELHNRWCAQNPFGTKHIKYMTETTLPTGTKRRFHD